MDDEDWQDSFGDEEPTDAWGDGDETPRVRSGARLGVQIGLFVVAALLLVWLGNVLADSPFWSGAVDWLSKGWWIGILLTLLVVLLVVEILLLRPAVVQRALDGHPLFDDDPLFMVGCPGCGTTFDRRHHEIDEPHEQRFACPNCGRQGHIKSLKQRRASVDDHWCTSCGKHYTVFQDHSECPHCRTPQEHALA